MLTFQTYKLLKSLRNYKLPYIIESLDYGLSYRVVEKNELTHVDDSLFLTYNKDNYIIARVDELQYLESESYITIDNQDIKFLHKGYRPFQISLIDLCHFLGKSVIVPILVTIATNFIMNHLK